MTGIFIDQGIEYFMTKSDIDIDVPDREHALRALPGHIKAAQINGDTLKPHLVGIYLQDVPTYGNTDISSIDYKSSAEHGFFKVDILNNAVYDDVTSEEHLDELISRSPDWTLLLDEKVVVDLFQISRYADLLKEWKPSSIEELAMFISMIRPSKKHLFERKDWSQIKEEIWSKPKDGSPYFKKSHAIAYSMAIVVQLNLIR